MNRHAGSRRPFGRQGTWRTYSTAEGLVGLQVEHIAEDREGYLWFATCTGGVSRFDGEEFRTFTCADGLGSDQVYFIHPDRQGRLWFGTRGGACWYDGRKFHRPAGGQALSRGVVTHICEDRQGVIWMGGFGVLGYWEGEDFHDLVPEHTRWCGNPPPGACWGIDQDREGGMWFGFWGSLLRYDGAGFHEPARRHGFGDPHSPFAVAQDGEGALWIGQGNKVWRYAQQRFEPFPLEFAGNVRKIQPDRQGGMWFCLAPGGALCLEGGQVHRFTARDGLAGNNVSSVVQNREDQFWFAIWGGGASCFDPHSIRVLQEEGLPREEALAVLEDRGGNIWVGLTTMNIYADIEEGVACYDGQRLRVWGAQQGLDIGACHLLCQDLQGRVWLGGRRGLACYDGQAFVSMGPTDGFDGTWVTAGTMDEAGRLFFGHWDRAKRRLQVSRCEGRRFQLVFDQEKAEDFSSVNAIVKTRDGALWLALGVLGGQGRGQGLGRLDAAGEWTSYTAAEGLADDRVEDVLEDRRGLLWIATLGGVSCFDGWRFRNFTSADGLPSNHIRCIYEDRQGQLWLGTDGGVVRYDGRAFQTIRSEHIGLVSKIAEDQQRQFWLATLKGVVRYRPGTVPPQVQMLQVIADQVYRDAGELEISAGVSQVIFEYKGLGFRTSPRDMLYTCCLQGHDQEWRPATRDRRAYYQGLKPGEYVFRVRAVDRDLLYSEPAELRLRVVPDRRDQEIDALKEQVEETQHELEAAQAQLIVKLEQELQAAHEMQMRLMPKEQPRLSGFGLAGRCLTANHMGGDFFQYYHRPQGRLVVAMADATGHDMEAAIPVVMFSGILKSHIELPGSVGDLFFRLNRFLHGTLDPHTFICFLLGELDLKARIFRLSSAGFPYPYHYQHATGQITEIRLDAYPLGVRPDTEYFVVELQLEPGDGLVCCSDGIIEAADASGELFGYERVAETIRRGCEEGLRAEALLEYILQAVERFTGGLPREDDQTLVVLKVEKEQAPCAPR